MQHRKKRKPRYLNCCLDKPQSVGPLPILSSRAAGEDCESNPESRGSDASNDHVQSIEREDGRNKQQDQAHQTP